MGLHLAQAGEFIEAMRNGSLSSGRRRQEFVAVVETGEGLGVVVRALRGRNGTYAPTLLTLIEKGQYTPNIEALSDEFADWLINSPLIVGDLHVGNVVLIDPMGEKNLIPLNSYFPGLNRASTGDRLRRTRRVIVRRLAAEQTRPDQAHRPPKGTSGFRGCSASAP